jgi:thioredoxin-like negative regulator of GroEL
MSLPIITEIKDRNHFAELLKSNPGLFIIKFGAEWCGPCKTINNDVKNVFEHMPSNVQCATIDIDKCTDVYSFLRTKRVVNGVPVILCYVKRNTSHIPDDIVVGADKKQIGEFFIRCDKLYQLL